MHLITWTCRQHIHWSMEDFFGSLGPQTDSVAVASSSRLYMSNSERSQHLILEAGVIILWF